MNTGSEDLEDLVKGYLKSGKVLENKLHKISTMKAAVASIDQNEPVRKGDDARDKNEDENDNDMAAISISFKHKDFDGISEIK